VSDPLAEDFYDAGPIKQIAINLFYGWGYNFYRLENQLRADDQLIRSRAAGLLGQAHASLDGAEQAWRREHLPPPSRAKPFPDAAAVQGAQALERLSHAAGALVGRLHALPVPENDRMTQRYRHEADTLEALGGCDELLIGQSEMLRAMVDHKGGDWLLDNRSTIEAGLAAIEETVRRRGAILM
jgi:hypothetical protein